MQPSILQLFQLLRLPFLWNENCVRLRLDTHTYKPCHLNTLNAVVQLRNKQLMILPEAWVLWLLLRCPNRPTFDPTDQFTILEPQNPSNREFYVVWERRSTDYKALKFWMGRSGTLGLAIFFFGESKIAKNMRTIKLRYAATAPAI